MKCKKGYILLESIVSLSIMSILILLLYSLLIFCLNIKNSIEDKIELQQQAMDMTRHIEDVIGNSMGIIGVNISNKEESEFKEQNYKNVNSIKCKYKNEKINNSNKDIELNLKEGKNKLFINSINNEISSRGGYEIGDYIDKIYVNISKDGKYVNMILKLSKNKQIHESKFKIYIRNFEGDII
ncbi:hypothetical protein CHF27_001035 [Romboutsia maritimum]|uniref:Uncharacterized protein n=1 Tax=Romboutsia maritimum TaxID=2020948 RepID=A0A371IWF3_9FIRM|nr:prepilin-type N-terminal cleavage/methylation domain-containing protein [Romboutsia maritimum]RDY24813.1 hypothetical protein CHF27_001035 [Romboutsia maritimum]